MAGPTVNLLGLARADLEQYFSQRGEKPFRARQIMKWIYHRGERDFSRMTDIGKPLREQLSDTATLGLPDVVTELRSTDGSRKWLLGAGAGQAIEMVYIPEPDRGTLCVSSQVGCVLDCSFCSTAQQGFNRNLTAAEIVGQVWLANQMLGSFAAGERPVTNVVLMGMGEPLANYRQVVPALRVLIDEFGFELSHRRVTVSTSGLVPQIDRLGQECNVALAVSLHAADDSLRNELVPINRRHPIAELLQACWRYARGRPSRQITFEYVMLDGVNDSTEQARRLARLLARRPAKVNLIPFNPFPGTHYRRSPLEVIERFRQVLVEHDIVTTIRRTRGEDIDAACGQLVGRVRDRTTVRLGEKLVTVAVQ